MKQNNKNRDDIFTNTNDTVVIHVSINGFVQ